MAKLVGTAGHVDHGKTSLIRALTGIDADRLPEEKKRGMTIDVGYAFLDLPKVGRVSIVDVPGHEKFLTNMLVGALGIDVALLCVAADEAVMPQTREHVDILKLLPVDQMVVALTRADLADEDTRALARTDITELLAETRFAGAPIIEVSSVTGDGIDALKQALTNALALPGAKDKGPWYLPIDRVFTVKGHGCVVTGTLAQGTVKSGEKAYIQPGNREARVRAIHAHGDPIESGEKGQRIGLNLSGVRAEDVQRGQTIGAPGAVFETDNIDAKVSWNEPIKHGSRIRVSIGADEAIGRIFLSDSDPELVQLRLETRVAAALAQPLIVRRYSPPDVICGGRVLVPQARRRKKGEALRVAKPGQNEEEAILSAVATQPAGMPTEEVCRILGKSPQALGDLFERLQNRGKLRGFAGLWFTTENFGQAWKTFTGALEQLHAKNPTSASVPRERVVQQSGLGWSGKPLDRILAAMAQDRRIALAGTAVRLPGFKIQLSPKQRQFLDRVITMLEEQPVNTPNPHQISVVIHVPIPAIEEVLRLGVQAGEIVSLGEGVYYTPKQIAQLKERIVQISKGKPFSASQVRDALGTTRKYIIPLLEHLDSTRFTTRMGDNRVINRSAG